MSSSQEIIVCTNSQLHYCVFSHSISGTGIKDSTGERPVPSVRCFAFPCIALLAYCTILVPCATRQRQTQRKRQRQLNNWKIQTGLAQFQILLRWFWFQERILGTLYVREHWDDGKEVIIGTSCNYLLQLRSQCTCKDKKLHKEPRSN